MLAVGVGLFTLHSHAGCRCGSVYTVPVTLMLTVGKDPFTLCLSLSSRHTHCQSWRCPCQFDKDCTIVRRHQDWCRSVMKSVMKNKPLAGILLDDAVQCVTLIQLAATQV